MQEVKVRQTSGRAQVASLPVPPKVVARVIQMASQPDSTARELAGLIQTDPTLTAQVLRAVNATHYGLRRKIDSVPHAVSFMGMAAIRNLVLCLGVQQLLHRDEIGDFPLDRYWEGCVQRAAAAACLARRLRLPQPDEFFTLGLCQDIGLLVRLRREPAFGSSYAACFSRSAEERLQIERENSETHEQLGADLLETWKLPEDMTTAIRFHHDPDQAPASARGRCAIAWTGESIADLLQAETKAEALGTALARLERLQLDPVLLHAIVEEVCDGVIEAGEMLQMKVGVQPTYEEIIAQAGDALVALQLSQPRAAGHAREELNEQYRVTAELSQRNEELQRQAATDPLTGLHNRRMFDEAVTRELSQARRQEAALSVLLLDIDHFKKLNDTHGHPAGDAILKRVASILGQMVRKSDTCARYGGEEFGIVLPYAGEEGARLVAERIRGAVSKLTVEWEGQLLSATISVGGVTTGGADSPEAAEVVRAADRALYRAKQEGRDRIWCQALEAV